MCLGTILPRKVREGEKMKNKTTKTGENKMSETITRTRDEVNPDYMFQTTNVELLAKIACGDLDPVALVLRELRNRGLNSEGRWVGFDKPEKETMAAVILAILEK